MPPADTLPSPIDSPPVAIPQVGASAQGVLRLQELGVIAAVGPDAGAFLQGQLTQDVTSMGPAQARLAGYCSAKGRLLASFIVWREGPEDFRLVCSADLLAPTLKRLSMFVLRAKCKLSDASATTALYGLAGASALVAAGVDAAAPAWSAAALAAGRAVRLPDVDGTPRALLALPIEASPPSGAPLDAGTWQALEVRSGIVRITAATVEKFVPQMANLELVGGVSFKKGCYPGQEIVARSQYRGTLKRRTFLAAADAPVAAGTDVFHDADPSQPVGTIALSAADAAGAVVALAELKIAESHLPGTLRAGGAVLSLRPLPYDFPADAA